MLEKLNNFNFSEFFFKNRYLLLVFLSGLIVVGFGVLIMKNSTSGASDKVEVLGGATEGQNATPEIVVEISGEVVNPGVYKLSLGARVDNLLIAAGGLGAGADRDWVQKNINRAAKLTDGQKIFIQKEGVVSAVSGSQSTSAKTAVSVGGVVGEGLVNINTSDAKTLDSLSGIGPVYAQNIIEHRPYSDASELVSKGAISQSVYEKIKDKISIY